MKLKTILLILVVVQSCKAQVTPNTFSIEDLIATHFMALVKNDIKVSNSLVSKTTIGKSSEVWETLLNKNQFSFIRNFDRYTEDDIIHFNDLFSAGDFDYMKDQVKASKITLWTQILNAEIAKQVLDPDGLQYSLPVFTLDGNYAILYVESKYSGDLKVFKKVERSWKYIASGLVWIE